MTTPTPPTLLTLPPELRLRIYTFLLTHLTLKITPAFTTAQQDITDEASTPWTMARHPLSSQLLRCNHQLYNECHPLLYSTNTFDTSCREGTKLLLHSIGSLAFSLVTHLVLDWDSLLDFSFMLARPDAVAATAGLISIDMATWRMRVTGERSGFLWSDVRSSERSMCEAALGICQKSRRLRVVAQRVWDRVKRGLGGERVMRKTERIKWRFVVGEGQLLVGETRLDLETELMVLRQGGGSAKDEGGVQMALDPI